jgi:acyl-coenzyme A thioesterase PaaI-like protein
MPSHRQKLTKGSPSSSSHRMSRLLGISLHSFDHEYFTVSMPVKNSTNELMHLHGSLSSQ